MDEDIDLMTEKEAAEILGWFKAWVASVVLNHDLTPLEVWSLIGAQCEASIFEAVGNDFTEPD